MFLEGSRQKIGCSMANDKIMSKYRKTNYYVWKTGSYHIYLEIIGWKSHESHSRKCHGNSFLNPQRWQSLWPCKIQVYWIHRQYLRACYFPQNSYPQSSWTSGQKLGPYSLMALNRTELIFPCGWDRSSPYYIMADSFQLFTFLA